VSYSNSKIFEDNCLRLRYETGSFELSSGNYLRFNDSIFLSNLGFGHVVLLEDG
jgi:hypothetical protein